MPAVHNSLRYVARLAKVDRGTLRRWFEEQQIPMFLGPRRAICVSDAAAQLAIRHFSQRLTPIGVKASHGQSRPVR